MRKIYLPLISLLLFSSVLLRAQTPDTHLSYDGSFNYTTLPANLVAGLNGSFTIEAWVYWRGGSAQWSFSLYWHRILDIGNDQNNYIFLTPESNINSRNGVMLAITIGGTFQLIQSTTPLPMNVWTHVAFTVDNATNTGNLFVNGVLDPTATNTSFTYRPATLGPTTNNWIGQSEFAGSPSFDPYFNGDIDELRISNVVRYTADFTPSLIQFTPDANTIALFHFNEGSGQTTADATGNFGNAFLGANATVEPANDPTWATLSPLPVKLTDFSARLNESNRTVDIKWTASMDASTEFILERSNNGVQFNPVYTLNKPIGTNGFETFSYRDNNPFGGRSFYRLKCTEVGSAPVYSRIVPISFNSKNPLLVYPNPVRGGQINIELFKAVTGNVDMRLYNASGMKVYSKTSKVENQREFQFTTGSFPKGAYELELIVNGVRQSMMITLE